MAAKNETAVCDAKEIRILRAQVEARTGLSRSTIYAKLRRNSKRPSDYDPTFLSRCLLAQRLWGGWNTRFRLG